MKPAIRMRQIRKPRTEWFQFQFQFQFRLVSVLLRRWFGIDDDSASLEANRISESKAEPYANKLGESLSIDKRIWETLSNKFYEGKGGNTLTLTHTHMHTHTHTHTQTKSIKSKRNEKKRSCQRITGNLDGHHQQKQRSGGGGGEEGGKEGREEDGGGGGGGGSKGREREVSGGLKEPDSKRNTRLTTTEWVLWIRSAFDNNAEIFSESCPRQFIDSVNRHFLPLICLCMFACVC